MHTKKDGLLFPPVEVDCCMRGSFLFRFLVSFVGRCLGDVFIYEFFNIGYGNFVVVVVVDIRLNDLPTS